MRVCILAQASPASWAAFYNAAFRRRCEVISVGPNPDAAMLRKWGREGAAHLVRPNDIDLKLDEDFELDEVLPDGWEPDLVVGISGLGGDALWPGVAKLACPSVFISIDTWQCMLDYREALLYDFVFCAQREYADHLRATGSRHVAWLPLACDPESHYPVDLPPTHDIAFAGMFSSSVHDRRRWMIEKLSSRFSVLSSEGVFGDEMCRFNARGRLIFNCSAVQEINMRIFEVMAMGRPLLTNTESEINGLFDLFEEDRHLIGWRDEGDLLAKAETYLADDAAREKIAREACELVMAEHTYDARVETILDTVARETCADDPRRRETAYRTDSAADYLPTVPGVTLDWGLSMGVSRIALRRRGVTRFIGIHGGGSGRPGSYDEVLSPESAPVGKADTVVVASIADCGMPLEALLSAAHALLQPGGILVLRLSGAEREATNLKPEKAFCSACFEPFDFHCRLCGPEREDGGFWLQLRKRTRHLNDIIESVYTRLQVPDIDIPDLVRRIPKGW